MTPDKPPSRKQQCAEHPYAYIDRMYGLDSCLAVRLRRLIQSLADEANALAETLKDDPHPGRLRWGLMALDGWKHEIYQELAKLRKLAASKSKRRP